MYPFFRLLRTLSRARKRTPIRYFEPSSIEFRCQPWDLDMFNEMNNGKVLTLYDLGRMDLAIRSQFMAMFKKKKWSMAVAGSSIRYRKSIKLFNKITMHTRLVAFDSKWLYFEQSMWVGETAYSSVLIRAGIISKHGLIEPSVMFDAVGITQPKLTTPLWVNEWIESEQHRPWPPARSRQ